jgi:hypothetical protein
LTSFTSVGWSRSASAKGALQNERRHLTKREPLKRATINDKVLLLYVRKAPTGTDVYQLTFDGHTVTSWIEGDAESGDTLFRLFGASSAAAERGTRNNAAYVPPSRPINCHCAVASARRNLPTPKGSRQPRRMLAFTRFQRSSVH